jgi:hypothetical protein
MSYDRGFLQPHEAIHDTDQFYSCAYFGQPERSVPIAKPNNHPIADTADVRTQVSTDNRDELNEAVKYVQDAIDETDRAIATHARYLKDSIREIDAMLGASAWRNPFD